MIVCVKTGSKYGLEYVTRLQAGVRRHLPESDAGHAFVCFTDAPVAGVDCRPLPRDLPIWWSKLGLFGLNQPLIYFDLDVVIVGALAPLLDWDGFGIIKNPWLKGYNSSVMKLTGAEGHVLDRFVPGIMATMRGDQDWLNVTMPDAPTFPMQWFPSWKVHRLFMLDAPPQEAIACICHGTPRPHEIDKPWFRDRWLGRLEEAST